MSDAVRLETLAVSKPRRLPLPFGDEEGEEWIEIEIGLKNDSASKTYYVLGSIRALRYDAETHTLVVSCSEPVRTTPMSHIAIPDTVPLLPGESTTISVRVPMRMKVLPLGKSLRSPIEIVDIGEVEQVTCLVQYAEVPFHATRESADEINRELAEWGMRTETRFLARIGEEGRAA
jgi:hypothetical protein